MKKHLVLLGGFFVATCISCATFFLMTIGDENRVFYNTHGYCETHQGYHYNRIDPTCTEDGCKEYWVCCTCHQKYLETPSGGVWVNNGSFERIEDSSDARYLSKTGHTFTLQDTNIAVKKNDATKATATTYYCNCSNPVCNLEHEVYKLTSKGTDESAIFKVGNPLASNITFRDDYGSGGGISKSTYYCSDASQTVTITPPSWTGYDLTSYSITKSSGEGTPTVAGNTVTIPAGCYDDFIITPNYTVKTYSVTKASITGGSLTVNSTGTYNQNLALSWSNSGETGYDYSNPDVSIYSDSVCSNRIAHYTSGTSANFNMSSLSAYYPNIYVTLTYNKTLKTTAITLDKNYSETGSGGSVTATYSQDLPTFTPLTRSHYDLNGYYTATTGGSKVINANGSLVANVSGYTDANAKWINVDASLTLYAQWSIHTFTITWENDDGTELTHQTYNYGATPSYPYSNPTKPYDANYHYSFNGWSPAIVTVAGNATYTATYTQTAHSSSSSTVVTAANCITKQVTRHTCACGYQWDVEGSIDSSKHDHKVNDNLFCTDCGKLLAAPLYACSANTDLNTYKIFDTFMMEGGKDWEMVLTLHTWCPYMSDDYTSWCMDLCSPGWGQGGWSLTSAVNGNAWGTWDSGSTKTAGTNQFGKGTSITRAQWAEAIRDVDVTLTVSYTLSTGTLKVVADYTSHYGSYSDTTAKMTYQKTDLQYSEARYSGDFYIDIGAQATNFQLNSARVTNGKCYDYCYAGRKSAQQVNLLSNNKIYKTDAWNSNKIIVDMDHSTNWSVTICGRSTKNPDCDWHCYWGYVCDIFQTNLNGCMTIRADGNGWGDLSPTGTGFSSKYESIPTSWGGAISDSAEYLAATKDCMFSITISYDTSGSLTVRVIASSFVASYAGSFIYHATSTNFTPGGDGARNGIHFGVDTGIFEVFGIIINEGTVKYQSISDSDV